jgi:hypothetical protein
MQTIWTAMACIVLYVSRVVESHLICLAEKKILVEIETWMFASSIQ